MNIIDYLKQYKEEFTNMGVTEHQKHFLRNNFIKWYMDVDKIGVEGIFPKNNIFLLENYKDLIFANNKLNIDFDLYNFYSRTQVLYNKYAILVSDLLYNARNDIEVWIPMKCLINKKQKRRFKYLYTLNSNDMSQFERDYAKLITLYDFIDMGSSDHLSIPPIFKGIELFGSPANSHNIEYCSLFPLEKKFGSLGSFWDYTFHRNGTYLCNPPFNENIIARMSEKILTDMYNTKFDIIVIITIPVWDSYSQKVIKSRDFRMPFIGYENLVNNIYLREKLILDKFEYKYWNYHTKQNVASSYTHLIILSNDFNYKNKFDIFKFAQEWKSY